MRSCWSTYDRGLIADDIETLGLILPWMPRLKNLALDTNGLGDAGMRTLCTGLGRAAAPSLRVSNWPTTRSDRRAPRPSPPLSLVARCPDSRSCTLAKTSTAWPKRPQLPTVIYCYHVSALSPSVHDHTLGQLCSTVERPPEMGNIYVDIAHQPREAEERGQHDAQSESSEGSSAASCYCTAAIEQANPIATQSLIHMTCTGCRCLRRRDARFMKAQQTAAPTGKTVDHAEQPAAGAPGLLTSAAPTTRRAICSRKLAGMLSRSTARASSTRKMGDDVMRSTTVALGQARSQPAPKEHEAGDIRHSTRHADSNVATRRHAVAAQQADAHAQHEVNREALEHDLCRAVAHALDDGVDGGQQQLRAHHDTDSAQVRVTARRLGRREKGLLEDGFIIRSWSKRAVARFRDSSLHTMHAFAWPMSSTV